MQLQGFIESMARAAGDITLRYFNSPLLKIETKSNETPVTQADKQAEEFLRHEIHKHFPADSIIGEEFGEELTKSDRRWIIDPLDGTKTFLRGVPFYGTLIALEEGDTVTHGCIYLPALHEVIYAERTKGCFWNGNKCHVSEVNTIENATLVTTDDAQLARRISNDAHTRLQQNSKLWRSWGDCYGYALIATGRADGMLDPECAIWDVAPMAVILEEAGGQYGSFEGKQTIRGGNLIASNSQLYDALLRVTAPIE